MFKFLFLDTETTGTGEEDRLYQVAYRVSGEKQYTVNELYKPPLPIKIGAMAISHVTNEMVADKRPFLNSKHWEELNDLRDQGYIFIAHNAKFDLDMLAKEGVLFNQYICTMKLARHVDPGDMENHQLQYLRYYYGCEVDTQGLAAHDALADILVLEAVFKKLAATVQAKYNLTKEDTVQKMIEISMNPVLLEFCTAPKHKGKTWAEVAKIDRDYLEWNLTRDNLSEDLEYTLKYHLGKL